MAEGRVSGSSFAFLLHSFELTLLSSPSFLTGSLPSSCNFTSHLDRVNPSSLDQPLPLESLLPTPPDLLPQDLTLASVLRLPPVRIPPEVSSLLLPLRQLPLLLLMRRRKTRRTRSRSSLLGMLRERLERMVSRLECEPTSLLRFACRSPSSFESDRSRRLTRSSLSLSIPSDYQKLVRQFGTANISPELIARFERLTGEKAHLLLRRGTFFSHR